MSSQQANTTYQQTSQLLLRNMDRVVGDTILVINYPQDPMLRFLQHQFPTQRVIGFTYDYANHRYAIDRFTDTDPLETNLFYGDALPSSLSCDTIVVYLPKSRQLTHMILQMAATVLAPGANLLLVGQNNAGIRAGQRLLAEAIGPAHKVDAARHCTLFQATLQEKKKKFDPEEWGVLYQVKGRQQLTITSFPGVFSHGRLDAGTGLLLETVQDLQGERLLDFGCGCGVIGATAKTLWPSMTVDLVDINAFALLAARCTLVGNSFTADHIYPSDIFSDVQGSYDWILSNPPFHQGIKTDYEVTLNFIEQSAGFLNKGGRLRIVANRFLKYQPAIERHIGTCRVITENRQYCVYEATRN